MKTMIFSGRGNPSLAKDVCAALSASPGRCTLEDFPDDELHVAIHEDVKDADVYVIQPTGPPVGANLLELLLLADACERAGGGRLTGVVPYFGYARQDRRVKEGEPVGGRLLADLLSNRFQRIVLLDLHNPAIEGFFPFCVEHLSAVPLLTRVLQPAVSEKHVLVAPDLGAVKLAQRYADRLKLPVAYIHKERRSGREVTVRHVIGEVRGRSPVVVDDMISTGGTVASTIEALLEKGCSPEVTVAATHGLFAGDACRLLASLPVQKILVTDSVPQRTDTGLPLQVVSLKNLLADAIQRLSTGHD